VIIINSECGLSAEQMQRKHEDYERKLTEKAENGEELPEDEIPDIYIKE